MSVETIEEALNDKINEQSSESENESNQSEHSEENTEEVQEATEEWQPDYNYSIKSEQREFDDWIRPAIKDADTEAYVRELYTRAYGLDHVKTNLESERERAENLERQIHDYKHEVDVAHKSVDGLKRLAKEDFASFAHITGLDDQTILNYANNRLDYREKPEYERRQIDTDMERRTQAYTSNLEIENLRRQNEQLMQRQHNQSLAQAMSVPEISDFEKEFDGRMGEGAFRQHVNNYGSAQYRQTQQYVEPAIAVQSVYSQFKPLFIDKLDSINKGETTKQTKPPTNLGTGRTSSVVKKRLKSLNDLRKRANELAKEEGYAG